jgi:hypothetical protein
MTGKSEFVLKSLGGPHDLGVGGSMEEKCGVVDGMDGMGGNIEKSQVHLQRLLFPTRIDIGNKVLDVNIRSVVIRLEYSVVTYVRRDNVN